MPLQLVCFVPSVGASTLNPKAGKNLWLPRQNCRCIQFRPVSTPRMSGNQTQAPQRVPWPVGRFLKTALWFSPLGRMVRGSSMAPTLQSTAQEKRDAGLVTRRDQQSVLVTGAAGGVGRRVVRELLNDGSKVKALVRDLERAKKALNSAGIEPENYHGRLEFVVADLHSLPADLCVDVDAVISCTGTKVGPPDDTLDRAKYRQGVKFYQPEILESSPEGVEYIGIKNLVELAKGRFENVSKKQSSSADQTLVLSFDSPSQVQATWGALDDVVMGGVSQSQATTKDGLLQFSGMLSTSNSGGFASVRTVDFASPVNLRGYDGLSMRVKGDGKRYKFIIRCDNKWDGISHCFSFDTIDGEWATIEMPFSSFNTVFRAKTIPGGKPLDRSHISAFQIMLSKFEYDKELNPAFSAGPFELLVDAVYAYRRSSTPADSIPVLPRFVHIGSGASTRVLRKNEFKPEEIPAIVQLSDSLGRLLEWKLAGEDVIRSNLAPYGYTIIRPCALTEGEPQGITSLEIAQGDRITGTVSRDDVARLAVEALYSSFVNKTFEVRGKTDSTGTSGDLKDIAKTLSIDTDAESRTYANFPYVPS